MPGEIPESPITDPNHFKGIPPNSPTGQPNQPIDMSIANGPNKNPDVKPSPEPTVATPPDVPKVNDDRSNDTSALNIPANPIGGEERITGGQAGQGVGAGRWDRFVNEFKMKSLESGFTGTPGLPEGAMSRYFAEKAVESSDASMSIPKLTPQEANAKYPGMEVPFDSNVDPFVAKMRYDVMQQKKTYQDWINRSGGPPGWIEDLGMSVAQGATDPVNWLAGAGMKMAGFAGGIIKGFGVNLGINTATEAMSYIQAKREGVPITVAQAAENAVGGAITGTLLHHFVISPAMRALKVGVDFIKGTPEDIQARNTKAAMAALESNNKVDLSSSVEVTKARMNGGMDGGTQPQPFVEMTHPSERPLYASKSAVSGETIQTDNLGKKGLYLSDKHSVANNMVSNPETNTPAGRIGEFHVSPESKFLDLDHPASQHPEFIEALEKQVGHDLKIEPDETLKDIMNKWVPVGEGERIPGQTYTDIHDQAQAVAQEQGYDGYKYINRDDRGVATDNRVKLFDENAKPTQSITPDPEYTPKITPEQSTQQTADEMGQKKNQYTYATPELEQEYKKVLHNPDLKAAQTEGVNPVISERVKAMMTELDEMAKDTEHPDNTALADELKELRRQAADNKQEQGVAKTLGDCVVDSII